MKHLKIEEIIDFVSARRYDSRTAELASRVNTHIIVCKECFKKVNAYQTVYDELSDLCKSKVCGAKRIQRSSFSEADLNNGRGRAERERYADLVYPAKMEVQSKQEKPENQAKKDGKKDGLSE